MTPAQRAYFTDIARSMRREALVAGKRLPRLALVLTQGADALEYCLTDLLDTASSTQPPEQEPGGPQQPLDPGGHA